MDFGDGRVSAIGSAPLGGAPADSFPAAANGTTPEPLAQPVADLLPARKAVLRRRYLDLMACLLLTAGWIVLVVLFVRTVFWVDVVEPLGLAEQVTVKTVDVQSEPSTAEGVRLWGVTVEWADAEGVTHQDARSVSWNPERGTYYVVAAWGDHVSLYGSRWWITAFAVFFAFSLTVCLVHPWRASQRFREWGKVSVLVGTERPMPMVVTDVKRTNRFLHLPGRPKPSRVSTVQLDHDLEGSRYRPKVEVRDRSGGIRPMVGDAMLQWAARRDHDWYIVIHRPADDTWWAATSYYFGDMPPQVD